MSTEEILNNLFLNKLNLRLILFGGFETYEGFVKYGEMFIKLEINENS